ncbi:hypothetical protein NXW13_07620 [Bacteroides thetaiotaomicron]|nr:hypothetical protein [Bacteroides thetaiotaomicron]
MGASNAAGKGAIFYFELPLFTDTCGQLEPASVEAATGVEVNEPDRIDYTFLKKIFSDGGRRYSRTAKLSERNAE